MPPAALPFVAGAEIASNAILKAITALYGTANSLNEFLNDHVKEMKRSENHTVSRTGDVLEMAKYGFGIGFISPIIIIATGQMILGNPLTATVVVLTAPLNPIAMTCAAVGAVYYGWNVLTDQEKNEILDKLSKGLKIGIEMIKSVIHFIINKTKEILSEENLNEIKRYIRSAAEFFGSTLGNVTNKFVDIITDTLVKFKEMGGESVETATDFFSKTIDWFKEQGETVIEKLTPNKDEKGEERQQEPSAGDESIVITKLKIKLSKKGQLTIPSEMRQKLDLSPHSEVELVIDGNCITLRKIDD